EDDIYGALRYHGRELPPLKSLDTAGLVIYLNSFSKVGFPGVRVGWIVAARRVIERLRAAQEPTDLHRNLLGQAVPEEAGRRARRPDRARHNYPGRVAQGRDAEERKGQKEVCGGRECGASLN